VKNKSSINEVVWYKSLSFTILFWFLSLSLVPLIIVSYESHKSSEQGFVDAAYNDLKKTAILQKKFIDNWFYYRKVDLSNWSQTKANIEFLSLLSKTCKESSVSLSEFTKSSAYMKILDARQGDLVTLTREYDYIYDILLLDNRGNILYTVEREDDLGKNLLTSDLSSTKFSAAYSKTIKDRQIYFSDLEMYKPSGEAITGFLTAPLVNDNGESIGVFAIQLKIDRILDMFSATTIKSSFVSYLVGEDSLLRNDLSKSAKSLKYKIDTNQFNLWLEKQNNSSTQSTQEKKFLIGYTGWNFQQVSGLQQSINIFGIKWVLITEVNEASIHAITDKMALKAFMLFLITMVIVVIVALLISQRIVRPLKILSDASMKFSKGERDIKVKVRNKGEIGLLASAFNKMVDALKKNEKKLKEQTYEAHIALQELDEQKFALDSHSIVSVTNIEGNLTYVNDKFIEITGYTEEELLGQNNRILSSGIHSIRFWEVMYEMVMHGKVWNDEVCNVNKEAQPYWLDTTIVPFKDEDGKPKSYIAISTDITVAKESELELIEAKEIAENSVKTKAEFLASMSHEIRTPMNGVIGMLDLLMNTKLDDTQKHQAFLAHNSAKALLTLINDILDFSKVEAGKMDLEHIDFNIRDELGNFAEAIAYRAQEKGVELVLDVKNIECKMINADPGRIRQILSNIVGNSIKFTSEGYVLIKASLKKEDDKKARLILEMSDTGIGIPQDKLDTLFDSFSQVDTSTTRKYGGTGLGLAIVERLCELMDGKIEVNSELGHGSTFTVDIAVNLTEKSSEITAPSLAKNKKVLIADSCKLNIDVIQNQLEHWGIEVFSAIDEEEVQEILDDEIFDIIFIDMKMEKLGEKIRKNSKHDKAKLVMMTSLEHREDISRYAHSHFNLFYPKPTTTKDIFYVFNNLDKQAHILTNKELHMDEEDSVTFSKNINILLVEDNLTNQLVANGILDNFGLEADIANHGEEALEILNTSDKKYDLILMDCQMPRLDGYDTTRAIRASKAGESYKKIPIVAMTANAMHGDKEKCEVAGMDDYLAKPIDQQLLKNILKKWLLGKTTIVEVEEKHSNKKEIPIWDKHDALVRLGNSEELLQRVIIVFLDDIPNVVKALEKAIEEENYEDIKLHAHSIKGSSANMSAIKLQKYAKHLELNSADMQSEELNQNCTTLKDMLLELTTVLNDYIVQNDNSEHIKSKLSKLEVGKILKELAIELRNGAFIDSSSVELFNSTVDEKTDAKINRLKKEIDGFLTDEALQTISEIIKG